MALAIAVLLVIAYQVFERYLSIPVTIILLAIILTYLLRPIVDRMVRFSAGRYHSLIVELESRDTPLAITARSDEGEIMGLRHRTHPTFGVQFHPESILTEGGYDMLRNFLKALP